MPEWVKNISDKPIPEPYQFSPEESALLFNLQRRKHLESYDARYHRLPLCSSSNCVKEHEHERTILERMERKIALGTVTTFRCIELRFAPGQIFQVPDGTSNAVAATCPEKLKALRWEDVRHLNIEPPRIHFQTVRENLEIIASIEDQDDTSLHHGPVTIEMKDGKVRHGDSKHWESAPTAITADIAAVMNRAH